MHLWMSAEVQLDVGDAYRLARNEIEAKINKALSTKDYGQGLRKLALIVIIRELDSPDYGEVKRYSKRKLEAEFRLKIDHAAFKRASPLQQRGLIIGCLIR